MENQEKLLLNRKEVAKLIGIDTTTFDKYIRCRDDLKRFLLGRQERYLESDIREWLKNHTI